MIAGILHKQQNAPFSAATTAASPRSRAAHSGGLARGYQAIFVPSTALGSPGYDGQPTVYLYIAALKVNVLNCREEVLPPRWRGVDGGGRRSVRR